MWIVINNLIVKTADIKIRKMDMKDASVSMREPEQSLDLVSLHPWSRVLPGLAPLAGSM